MSFVNQGWCLKSDLNHFCDTEIYKSSISRAVYISSAFKPPLKTHIKKQGAKFYLKDKKTSEKNADKKKKITKPKKWKNDNAITYWDEIYIKVDRQFTNSDSKYYLTVEELYIYILISIEQRKDWSIFTCIHMIEELMPLRFYKGKDRNREEIAKSLNSLAKKKIVMINGKIDYKNPFSTFFIRINYEEFESKNGWKGFNKIYLTTIQKVERIEHLYMYCTIKGFDKGYTCSYSEWSDLLNRSPSSIKRYAKEVVRDDYKLIEINYGSYLQGSRRRQEKNTYKVKKFSEHEKTNQTKQKDQEKRNKDINKRKGFGEDYGSF